MELPLWEEIFGITDYPTAFLWLWDPRLYLRDFRISESFSLSPSPLDFGGGDEHPTPAQADLPTLVKARQEFLFPAGFSQDLNAFFCATLNPLKIKKLSH